MAFIQKSDPVVINIKLTSKGRELLSRGELTFKKFGVGDSEIDYEFNREYDFNAYDTSILKPKDKNPQILSFITKTLSGDTLNNIDGGVVSNTTPITNKATEFGFFNTSLSNASFLTDETHVVQPDIMIELSTVTGGTRLKLYKSPTYLANVNEPEIGDFIMVKWTTPDGQNTTGYTVNKYHPTPYLIYKIQDIISGTLAANNLIINVDRELPDFNNNGSDVFAGAIVYPNRITITGVTNSSDFLTEATLAFINNYEQPRPEIPFWNLSIIFTEEIAGIKSTNKSCGKFKTNKYSGFVRYIQNLNSEIKKLGVIHYTNPSPENVYGEGFYNNTPVLDIPYIMWHKSSNGQMGLTLTCGDEHTLEGLNIDYYDLIDNNGNVLGKCFNYLKLFVIEDQELLYAMSYKSNRSWTLPSFDVGFNTALKTGCPTCIMTTNVNGQDPTTVGGNGKIVVTSIDNTFGDILIVVDGNVTKTTTIAASDIATSLPVTFSVPAGTYNIKIYDLGAIGSGGNPCVNEYNITIDNYDSILEIYDVEPTE